MTQPDQYWPTDAANYDSFAGFANKTQAEWETELTAGFNTAFGPWSGVCALLEQTPFIGDLMEMGGGPQSGLFGTVGAMLEGLTVIAERLCTLFLGTPPEGDTTPTTMLDGLTGLFDQLINSPFVVGLIDLGEDTGQLLTDIINALLGFINTLCSVFTGTYDANATTPQTILDGVTGVFDTITGSGFLQAFINFAQASGNLVIQILDGLVRWIDQAWNLIVAMFPTLFGKSPDDVLAGTITDNITSIINDMINAAMDWLDSLPELLSGVINALIGMIGAIPELILGLITGLLDWLAMLPEALTSLIEGLLNLITAIPELIVGTINAVLGWFSTDEGGLITSLVDMVVDLVTEIPELIAQIVNSLISWVDSIPELIANVVEAAIGWVDAIPELIAAVMNALISWVVAIPEIAGSILEAVVTLISQAPLIAESIVRAIITLIAAAPQLILDVIRAVLEWIDDVTGLNLSSWADLLFGIFPDFGGSGGILGTFMNSLLGFGSNMHAAIPNISTGQIVAYDPVTGLNMLIDNAFGANSFEAANGWFPNAQLGGTGPYGALVAVGDGLQTLISNGIPVIPGQTLNAAVTTSAAGLGGAGQPGGAPVSTNINLYGASGQPGTSGPLLTSVPIASYGYSSNPGLITDWTDQQLSGATIVPDVIDGQVPVEAAIMLVVSEEINSGEVHFREPVWGKPNLLPQGMVDNLIEDKQAIIDAAAGVDSADPIDINKRLVALSPGTGVVDWNKTPQLRTINDSIVNELLAVDGLDWGTKDSSDALRSTQIAGAANAMGLSMLQAKILGLENTVAGLNPPPPENVVFSDDFNTVYTANAGPKWDVTLSGGGTGHVCTSEVPGSLHWSSDAGGTRYARVRFNDTAHDSTTDYQIVRITLGGAAKNDGVYCGYNECIGRIGASSCVKFVVDGFRIWRLMYSLNSVFYTVISGTLTWQPINSLELYCGDFTLSDPTNLSCRADNVKIWGGPVSNHLYGANNRGMGLGVGIDHDVFSAPVTSWLGADVAA